MEKCPCNSLMNYSECCEPLLTDSENKKATTPLALMRSRYSAYALGFIDYIINSHHPEKRGEIDPHSAEEWSRTSRWHGLNIINTTDTDENNGSVEFVAHYQDIKGKEHFHHELAHFTKLNDTWFYSDGELVKQLPITREEDKLGRNDPCKCGSGKKYKKCCGK